MTPLCGACDRPMVTVSKGRGKWIIACPAGCYRLPAPSTVKGAKLFYESESEAVEVACKLYALMSQSHAPRPGDPRIHEKYRRAQRN